MFVDCLDSLCTPWDPCTTRWETIVSGPPVCVLTPIPDPSSPSCRDSSSPTLEHEHLEVTKLALCQEQCLSINAILLIKEYNQSQYNVLAKNRDMTWIQILVSHLIYKSFHLLR